jgi:hypothetical protein
MHERSDGSCEPDSPNDSDDVLLRSRAAAGPLDRLSRVRHADLGPSSKENARGRGEYRLMHGNERNVERRIRLWVVQQERNRRRESQLGRAAPRTSPTTQARERAVSLRKRAQWH